MSGDYFSHTDRKYDEIIERLEALERKVANSKLMMKRTLDGEYEKLVDVVCDHESRLLKEEEELQRCSETVSELSETDDANW